VETVSNTDVKSVITRVSLAFLIGIFDCNTAPHAKPVPIFSARQKAARRSGTVWWQDPLCGAFSPSQIKAQLLRARLLFAQVSAGMCGLSTGVTGDD